MTASARIFLSYAHEDEGLRQALGTHLAPLKRPAGIRFDVIGFRLAAAPAST